MASSGYVLLGDIVSRFVIRQRMHFVLEEALPVSTARRVLDRQDNTLRPSTQSIRGKLCAASMAMSVFVSIVWRQKLKVPTALEENTWRQAWLCLFGVRLFTCMAEIKSFCVRLPSWVAEADPYLVLAGVRVLFCFCLSLCRSSEFISARYRCLGVLYVCLHT